jgi:molecular chaperone GrpE
MQILELRQKLREKEAELEQKLKEMKQNAEQARHIQKQFDSYKARMNKEKSDWFNYGHEPVLKELLGVKDNLERAIHHAEETPEIESLREGVKLTLRQFNSILEKFGVSSIKAQGEPFNPEYHQAMMQAEDNSVPGGTVIDEHQSGYLLKDRLLRPSMVTVSKRTAPEEEASPDEGPVSESAEDETEKADSGPDNVPDPGGDK